jgi:hypothetical protein
MATRSLRRKRAMTTDVDLAVAAVEDSGRPLDLEVGDPDTSPTSLGLPPAQPAAVCQHHQYVCAVCGTPLRRNPE